MNSPYDPYVSKELERGAQILARDHYLSQNERDLAYGSQYFGIIYFLSVANLMVYGKNSNWKNNRYFVPAVFLISAPISHFTCKYLFGFQKLRDMRNREVDTNISLMSYKESNLKNKI